MAGFFFNNPDGTRQFDSNSWPCFGYIGKVDVPSSAMDFGSEFPFWSAKCIDITITGVSPMVAVRVPSSLHPVGGYPIKVGGIYSTRRSGNDFTFRVYVFGTNNDWSFTYYVFDRMTVPHDGMGLTFWDDATPQNVVFSTAMPFVKIAGSHEAGRVYAVVGFVSSSMTEDFNDDFNNPQVRYEVTGNGHYEVDGVSQSGSKVIDGGVLSGSSGPPYSGRDVAIMQAGLMIDVTGL